MQYITLAATLLGLAGLLGTVSATAALAATNPIPGVDVIVKKNGLAAPGGDSPCPPHVMCANAEQAAPGPARPTGPRAKGVKPIMGELPLDTSHHKGIVKPTPTYPGDPRPGGGEFRVTPGTNTVTATSPARLRQVRAGPCPPHFDCTRSGRMLPLAGVTSASGARAAPAGDGPCPPHVICAGAVKVSPNYPGHPRPGGGEESRRKQQPGTYPTKMVPAKKEETIRGKDLSPVRPAATPLIKTRHVATPPAGPGPKKPGIKFIPNPDNDLKPQVR